MKNLKLLVLGLILFSFHVVAQTEARMDQLFADSWSGNIFRRDRVYQKYSCYNNIYRLIIKANEQGIDVKNMNVLYFVSMGNTEPQDPEKDGLDEAALRQSYSIAPVKGAPRGKVNSWLFHVVLERDGYIYDLDFKKKPTVVPVEQYLKEMFNLPQEGKFMYMRVVPGEDYLFNFNYQVETFKSFWLGRDSNYYPLITNEDFIRNLDTY